MSKKVFQTLITVRDYECDGQGGVNNAVFFHYAEVGRYEFSREVLKIDFEEFTKKKVGFVVVHLEADFTRPLAAADKIVVETVMSRPSKRVFQFNQEIYKFHPEKPGVKKLAFSAVVKLTAVNAKHVAEVPEELERLMGDYPAPAEGNA